MTDILTFFYRVINLFYSSVLVAAASCVVASLAAASELLFTPGNVGIALTGA